jgi:D-arabinose 5-phosphate isomerase GutQ
MEPMADILSIARQTIRMEADALNDLADSLGETPDFDACVRALASSTGRLVLTGIG